MPSEPCSPHLTPQSLVEHTLAQAAIEVFSAIPEPDNAFYGARILHTSRGLIRVREGKVTPTKPGVFVAVWRSLDSGETGPFPHDDGVEFLLVTAQTGAREETSMGARNGAFLLPTWALVTRKIVSVAGAGGKRGFRLYPPWLTGLNSQASRTQRWQTEFFKDISG